MTKRVLIYRLGSLGDTIVALPCFRLIANRFPDAERRVLVATRYYIGKESSISKILEGTGLVDSYSVYDYQTRDPRALLELHSLISNWKPDLLINLASSRSLFSTLRDWIFFRLCGVRKMVGFPFGKFERGVLLRSDTGLYQHETERLLERLKTIGSIDLDDSSSWDLCLSEREKNRANERLGRMCEMPLIAIGMGTKVSCKDWGEENWRSLLETLAIRYSGHGLILIGSKDEADLCERTSAAWEGRRINLCGSLSPRESAAAIRMAEVFIGHDGGPMHLAASVGVTCVAIFSARDLPGKWYPYGAQHRVIYHQTDCFGCRLEDCEQHNKKCILSITVEEVLDEVSSVLASGDKFAGQDFSTDGETSLIPYKSV